MGFPACRPGIKMGAIHPAAHSSHLDDGVQFSYPMGFPGKSPLERPSEARFHPHHQQIDGPVLSELGI